MWNMHCKLLENLKKNEFCILKWIGNQFWKLIQMACHGWPNISWYIYTHTHPYIYIYIYIYIYTYIHISIYNPSNNFFGLSLDKTDHMIQNWIMVTRRYLPSNLISIAWFYFDGIKHKKSASVQTKLLIGHGKQKNNFCRSQWRHIYIYIYIYIHICTYIYTKIKVWCEGEERSIPLRVERKVKVNTQGKDALKCLLNVVM